jgi:hypothetical protein
MDTAELQTYLVENVPRHQFRNVTLVDLGQYGPVTYLFDLPHSKVLLWGIRGTNALFDLFQDLDAYSEAILIQLCTSLFPLYASPIFQPLLNKFVGTSYHLVETLATLKDVLLNRKQGSQMEITNKRKPGTRPGQGEATAGMRYYYDALGALLWAVGKGGSGYTAEYVRELSLILLLPSHALPSSFVDFLTMSHHLSFFHFSLSSLPNQPTTSTAPSSRTPTTKATSCSSPVTASVAGSLKLLPPV